MNLFFDQDMGVRLPRAIRLLGIADSIRWTQTEFPERFSHNESIADFEWIELVGRQGLLGISCDLSLLREPASVEAMQTHKAGVVFVVPGEAHRSVKARILLNHVEWLREVDQIPRPFAYETGLSGRPRRLALV